LEIGQGVLRENVSRFKPFWHQKFKASKTFAAFMEE
jgi:hypothetical protein